MMGAVAIIALLIVLNAVYVAAEFAIVAARRQAVEERAASGNAWAGRVLRIMKDQKLQDRYIATAQLGITLASLGLGMYGERALSSWIAASVPGSGLPLWLASHAAASAIAIIVLTYFHIVLGEMIPKAIALADADRAVVWMSPMIWTTQLAMYPLIVALNGLGNLLLRALRLPRQQTAAERYHTPEELQYIVRESEEEGLLPPQAAEVLEELLDFGHLTAGEVLVPRVRIRGVEFGCMLSDLGEVIRAAPHTRYPVFVGDLDHIVGTIHIKDVLRRSRQGRTITQGDIHPVAFIPETSTLDKVLLAMRQWRTQMAIVMDEHGGTAGLLTIEDLFEEVVGEIDDAVTGGTPELHRGEDGRLRAAGTVRVEEVGEELERPLVHEDVDTVSGLVLALLHRPPRVGDIVTFEGVQFKVLVVEGHGVAECEITAPPPEDLPGARDPVES
jgi:CBS domain containing-hemolysin-like protein